jgi:hypothetical protein
VGSFWFSCREPTGGAQLAGAPGFFGVILAGESRPNAAGVSKSEDYRASAKGAKGAAQLTLRSAKCSLSSR